MGGLVAGASVGWVGAISYLWTRDQKWREQVDAAKSLVNNYRKSSLGSGDLGPGALALREFLNQKFGVDSAQQNSTLENFCQLGNPCEMTPSEIAVLGRVEVTSTIAFTKRMRESKSLVTKINDQIRDLEMFHREIVKDLEATQSPKNQKNIYTKILALRNRLLILSHLFESEVLEQRDFKSPFQQVMTLNEGRSQIERTRLEIRERIELIEIALKRVQDAQPQNSNETEILAFLQNLLSSQQSVLAEAHSEIVNLQEDKTSWINWLQFVTRKAAILRAKLDTDVLPLLKQREAQGQMLNVDEIRERLPKIQGELPQRK